MHYQLNNVNGRRQLGGQKEKIWQDRLAVHVHNGKTGSDQVAVKMLND